VGPAVGAALLLVTAQPIPAANRNVPATRGHPDVTDPT
jgi:hypothetical protein